MRKRFRTIAGLCARFSEKSQERAGSDARVEQARFLFTGRGKQRILPLEMSGVFVSKMALPFGDTSGARDARAVAILAKTIYRELRSSGFEARDVVALAGELLGQVSSEVRVTTEVRRNNGGAGHGVEATTRR